MSTVGGCGVATQSGTITVNPDATIALTSASGSDTQAVCTNQNLPVSIVYTITNASGATASNLPPGMSGVYSGGTLRFQVLQQQREFIVIQSP
ncbi:MAG: hypothetical protein U0X58_04035 [Flavobacteriaceae bacterium]